MSKRIFLAPLDWGLGHATRCVPIVKELLKAGHEVILGITPVTSVILKEEFPHLKTVDVPEINIQYSSILPVWATVILDYPRLKKLVTAEKELAKRIVEEHAPDIIISDSRYGLHCEKTKNIFITHQLWVKAPFFESNINAINHSYLKNFDELWIPDFENEERNLSGELSHGIKVDSKIKYIGPLSRLKIPVETKKSDFDILFLLSGPEPKRTQLENEVLKFINAHPGNCCLVRGTSRKNESINVGDKFTVVDLPGRKQLEDIISNSGSVLCRSGYSTIMDLFHLEKNIFLIPTPGQTEQEYLADYLDNKFSFKKISKVSDLISAKEMKKGKLFSGASESLTLAIKEL